MNPANLPNPQDAAPPYGVVRTVLFFALYAAMIIGAVVYLRWKLPRQGGTNAPRREEQDDPAGGAE